MNGVTLKIMLKIKEGIVIGVVKDRRVREDSEICREMIPWMT